VTSRRTSPLPPHWQRIRAMVLLRDRHRCRWGELPGEELDGGPCAERATEADHAGPSWDHDPERLRALCAAHHARRTALQANAARWNRYRDNPPAPRKRPGKKHPALRDDPPGKSGSDSRELRPEHSGSVPEKPAGNMPGKQPGNVPQYSGIISWQIRRDIRPAPRPASPWNAPEHPAGESRRTRREPLPRNAAPHPHAS